MQTGISINQQGKDTQPAQERVAGMDSIRFIAALWVAFYHLGFSSTFSLSERVSLEQKILGAALDSVFCGPAAVIVFFVISGFCIHFPYRNGRKELEAGTFLLRRYIRILVPLLICIATVNMMGMTYDSVGRLVGWSIECELVYYTAYPLILILGRKAGWTKLIFIFFPLALLLVLPRNPTAMMYPSFGLLWNALLGLPCWLLGCKLAEGFKAGANPSPKTKLLWRVLVIASGSLTFSLMLHAGVGFPWTLNFFAIIAFFWLKKELFTDKKNCFSILEWGGKWSYSFYMMHGPLSTVYNRISGFDDHEVLSPAHWILRLLFVFAGSYLFYLAFEKTSHQFARRITKRR